MRSELDNIIRTSLSTFYEDIRGECWHRRERELVSLYAFGHLLSQCGQTAVLTHPTQIGIEVAVPQHVKSRRHDPDVCKDVVIWPQARMTCWGRKGVERLYPLAVLEWKSLNRGDNKRARTGKRQEFCNDIEWLLNASRNAAAFTGFAVLVDLKEDQPSLTCTRVAAGDSQREWLQLPNRSASGDFTQTGVRRSAPCA